MEAESRRGTEQHRRSMEAGRRGTEQHSSSIEAGRRGTEQHRRSMEAEGRRGTEQHRSSMEAEGRRGTEQHRRSTEAGRRGTEQHRSSMETEGRRGTEQQRSSMEAGRGRSKNGRREEVVKPKTRWNKERRLEVLGSVYDSQGRMPRFVRCAETLPNGSRRQLLLKRVTLEGSDVGEWQKDLLTWSQLSHAHILQYVDAWVTDDNIQHVLCENARMCLSVCLRNMAPSKPCRRLYPCWLFHIVSALEYMHERNNEKQPMLHRSLQPDNVLVTDGCILKLCAFGTAKRLDTAQGKTETRIGGAGLFQSPEIAEGKPYDQSTDIWSFGVTAAYIADYNRARKVGSVGKLLLVAEDSGQDKETQRVVAAALRQEPTERPKASHIVQHLQKHFSKDWLQSQPSRDLFPRPLLESTHNASSQEDSPNDPSQSKGTDGPKATASQNISQSQGAVQPDPEHRSCETLVETAEMTTQTSFCIKEPESPQDTEDTGTQTSRRHPHRPAGVIIIRTTIRPPRDANNSAEVLQFPADNITEELVRGLELAVTLAMTRHGSAPHRRRSASTTCSTSTASVDSTATAASTTPTSPSATWFSSEGPAGSSDTGDTQAQIRKHLERFHKDPNSSSETPGSHRSRPPGSKTPHSSHTGDGGGSRPKRTPRSSHTGDGGGSRPKRTPRSSHTGDGGGSRPKRTPRSSHTGDGGGSRPNRTPRSSHTGDGGGSRPTHNIDNESTVLARDRRKSTHDEDGLLTDEAKQILAIRLNRRTSSAQRTRQDRVQHAHTDSHPQQRCPHVRERLHSGHGVRRRRDSVDNDPRRHRPSEDETDDTSGFCDQNDI